VRRERLDADRAATPSAPGRCDPAHGGRCACAERRAGWATPRTAALPVLARIRLSRVERVFSVRQRDGAVSIIGCGESVDVPVLNDSYRLMIRGRVASHAPCARDYTGSYEPRMEAAHCVSVNQPTTF
jgi:hypothetical protein